MIVRISETSGKQHDLEVDRQDPISRLWDWARDCLGVSGDYCFTYTHMNGVKTFKGSDDLNCTFEQCGVLSKCQGGRLDCLLCDYQVARELEALAAASTRSPSPSTGSNTKPATNKVVGSGGSYVDTSACLHTEPSVSDKYCRATTPMYSPTKAVDDSSPTKVFRSSGGFSVSTSDGSPYLGKFVLPRPDLLESGDCCGSIQGRSQPQRKFVLPRHKLSEYGKSHESGGRVSCAAPIQGSVRPSGCELSPSNRTPQCNIKAASQKLSCVSSDPAIVEKAAAESVRAHATWKMLKAKERELEAERERVATMRSQLDIAERERVASMHEIEGVHLAYNAQIEELEAVEIERAAETAACTRDSEVAFSAIVAQKAKLEQENRHLASRHAVMARERHRLLDPPPAYWCDQELSKGLCRYPSTMMAKQLSAQLLQTFCVDCSRLCPGVQVISVDRIENPLLWRSFVGKRMEMRQRLLKQRTSVNDTLSFVQKRMRRRCMEIIDPSVNEIYLWHGCQNSTAERIASEGFDERTASFEGLYGTGSYFTAEACKALQYAGADGCSRSSRLCKPRGRICECRGRGGPGTARRRRLLYCRVLIGDPYCATSSMRGERRPPPRASSKGGGWYDSIVAGSGHSEFVIWNHLGAQAYPEFVVDIELA